MFLKGIEGWDIATTHKPNKHHLPYTACNNNAVGKLLNNSVCLLLCDREDVMRGAMVMRALQAAQHMYELNGRAKRLIWGFLM